jgi:hypothetical protein
LASGAGPGERLILTRRWIKLGKRLAIGEVGLLSSSRPQLVAHATGDLFDPGESLRYYDTTPFNPNDFRALHPAQRLTIR